MPELNLEEWRAFLHEHPEVHILQTAEWGELKSAFGWTAIRILVDGIGAQILFRRLPLGLTFGYLPKGPIYPSSPDQLGAQRRFWAEVDRMCRVQRAIFLKIEPNAWDTEPNPLTSCPVRFMKPSPQNVQPACTLVVDLSGSEADIFNRMKPKTRYNIRLAAKKGVTVQASEDLASYYQVMEVTSNRMHFHVHSYEYYQHAFHLFHPTGMCELLIAYFEGRALATIMVFAHGRQAYYLYGASSDEERNRKPTYPLQWEAMRWAKAHGCSEYDMWGIPDEDEETLEAYGEEREDGLWGVYRFKKGFGGTVKRTVPTMDRIYNPALYRLYLWRYAGSGAD
ncbi:MAG: peptidoglycan bridge formation glycyltransferase FemA/FemB family protein [Anaerolineales bacterium]|jgi:lipid II:glycine glycyltransferase (peptidoglycan interpeptide bridge formation enzyme)